MARWGLFFYQKIGEIWGNGQSTMDIWMMAELFPWFKKGPSKYLVKSALSHCWWRRHIVVRVYNQQIPLWIKTEWVSLKTMKTRLDSGRKHLEEPAQFWKKNFFGQMKPTWTWTRMMRREKYGKKDNHDHNLKRTTLCVKYVGKNILAWAWMAASGMTLVFTDDVTASRSGRMNFTVIPNQINNDPKHAQSKEIEYSSREKSITWSHPERAGF